MKLEKVKLSLLVYVLGLFILVVWLAVSYFGSRKLDNDLKNIKKQDLGSVVNVENPVSAETPTKYRRISDGVFVDSQELAYPYPTAIVIENLVEARPQAGLEQASVVYEAATEGGITRFLAIFDKPNLIGRFGPIRSVRPYFLDWGEEFGHPVFLHVGGSPDALKSIDDRQLANLDEFFWRDNYYQRVDDKKSPHDTYTTPELLQSIQDNYKLTLSEYEAWNFKDDTKLVDRGDTSVPVIDFSAATYKGENNYAVSWRYNKEDNTYTRFQGEGYHQLENDQSIQAKNVIIMFTDEKVVDSLGRLDVRTIGEGQAQIYRDGIKIDSTWKKASAVKRTRFYNGIGEEVEFNAGPTWIEVVPIKK